MDREPMEARKWISVMKILLYVALGVLLIVPRPSLAEDVVAVPDIISIPARMELTDSVELTSFFWPSSGCCADDRLAEYDRCRLWDGYCSSSQCLACEPGFVPLRYRWAPSRPCHACLGGHSCSGNCQPSGTPSPAPVGEPTPANSVPTPQAEPTDDAVPRNVIPTAQRANSPKRTPRHIASRAHIELEPPLELSPSQQVVPASFAAAPPVPETYDYHLPRSLRAAVRKSGNSPLAQQLHHLSTSPSAR